MQKKLLGTYILIISITIIFSVIISYNKINSSFREQIEHRTKSEAIIVEEIFSNLEVYDDDTINHFVNQYGEKVDLRITIIDDQGLVLADSHSDPTIMDNHYYREEVQRAFQTGEIQSSLRYSNTLGSHYQYVAVPVEFNGFVGCIRTATPLKEVQELINEMLLVVLGGIFLGSIVAFAMAYFLTKKIVAPIIDLKNASNEITLGNYDEKIYVNEYDEIGQLARSFNNMTSKLRVTMWELENKNSELRSILDSMNHGIIVVDKDLRITLKNERFLELFNISDDSIEGKLFYEVTRNLSVFNVLEQVGKEGRVIYEETKVMKDGVEKIFLVSGNAIRSVKKKNKVIGSLLVIQDVTDLRKLENIRTEFVSNVTHELKTPLTSIKGFVETLKDGAVEDTQVANRFLEIINIEVERLEGLINDILILSEIETLGIDKNLFAEDMGEIIEDVNELLEPKANKKGLRLEAEIAEDVKPYVCNKHRIKQLLINLVGNAIKYTEEGYVKVSCSMSFKQIVIEVEDSGIGIAKEHHERLFERFYRVDKGRSRKQGGTGLGLSIVKHIVELYNGRINIESEIDKGTKIIIHLPYFE